ncbi:GRIN [Lepeophtheirus salmonis]|uniref:GRIN n=1 Tax=Lepeophtheirus salmonis TaxID=72036 RepID=A0A7R8H5G8_LEPSM|nr:GRIN [Lepeophtheirus salmonis]CAF2863075.1 GRIN [Lepeophtheirus salmonis]
MANAERILFEKWKKLDLNSGAQTQSEFRVWDYPIQEQYFHILQVINRVGTVTNPKEGFDRVEAATDGDFAFLHDTLEVKFHYYEKTKERYFEKLTKKYWNIAKRDLCPVLDESQGITLRSLGGIFLAALAGLALSMIVLAVEVWKQKQQRDRQEITKPQKGNSKDDIMKVGTRKIRVTPMSTPLDTISNNETRSRRKSRSNYPFNNYY